MKHFLIPVLILVSISSISQTNKETTDWLGHYLNKNITRYFMPSTSLSNYKYSYDIQNVEFDSSYLIFQTDTYKKTDSYKDSFVTREWNYIDLSMVKKIDVEYDSYSINKYLRIKFYFNEWKDFDYGKLSVKKVDMSDVATPKLKGSGYYQQFNVDLIVSESIVNDNLVDRIKKAITHLCVLNGSKIMKEAF